MKPTPSSSGGPAVLNRARELLDNGQTDTALEVLNNCGQASRAIQNAKGVCLMRLGRCDSAVNVFRALVFPEGAICITEDIPTVFLANYVTALFLLDHVLAGLQVLRETPDRHHPAVRRLKAAVRRWKRSLPWWRRVLLAIGSYRPGSFRLDFVPGVLWGPEGVEGPRPAERAA